MNLKRLKEQIWLAVQSTWGLSVSQKRITKSKAKFLDVIMRYRIVSDDIRITGVGGKTFDLVKIRAKRVKTFAKTLYVLWIYKNSTQIGSAAIFFFLEITFLLRGDLGKKCFKCFDLKKCAQHEVKSSRFFGGYFLWNFFRAILGKNPLHPQRFACSYTYATNAPNFKKLRY